MDASPDGGCVPLLERNFDGNGAAPWQLFPSASVMDNEVVLVPAKSNRAGAMWLRLSAPITSFRARFTSRITPVANETTATD